MALTQVQQVGVKYVLHCVVDGARIDVTCTEEEYNSIQNGGTPTLSNGEWSGGSAIMTVFDTQSGELEPGTFFIAPDGSVAANFKGRYTTLEPGTISPDGRITKVSRTFCKDCVAPTEADIK